MKILLLVNTGNDTEQEGAPGETAILDCTHGTMMANCHPICFIQWLYYAQCIRNSMYCLQAPIAKLLAVRTMLNDIDSVATVSQLRKGWLVLCLLQNLPP